MAQDQTKIRLTHEAYTVAVVCAHEFEMRAVRYMLDEEHLSLPNRPDDENAYILGRFSRHNTVIAWLPESQSDSAAAMAAKTLHWTFPSIEWHILTGIGGGGTPGPHSYNIRLGDVVVGYGDGCLVQYSPDTEDADGGFLSKNFFSPPRKIMDTIHDHMEPNHMYGQGRAKQLLSRMLRKKEGVDDYQRPPRESDVLFAANYRHVPDNNGRPCENCDAERVVRRSPREDDNGPQVHFGLIASSVGVTRSTFDRGREMRKLHDMIDVLCFDIEAAGLDRGFPCVVIRGISDYADSHKNNVWQYYAAAAAAACTKELLQYFDPRDLEAVDQPCNGGSVFFSMAMVSVIPEA
ncbi:nucleoside phosphorylase domain-containing protein [Nemania sp. FL0031]|nr:nucleoside phosphorylase domain-containing protein [Nemania sp. FL0031]